MKKNIKIYFYGAIIFIVFLFLTFLFPYITRYFFYYWAKISGNNKYLFIDNIYQPIITAGFTLISVGIIGYVISKDLRKKTLKMLFLTILSIGTLIMLLFLIFKPVNDKIGFLKNKKNGNIYMYTGFHVKDKIIFIKKEHIPSPH